MSVPQCPRYRECGERLSSFTLGPVPSYIGIVSDSLSCVGSVAMVLIYLAWKDIRKRGAQSIVTFIAIADFFTALSYFSGSVNILTHYNVTDEQKCKEFATVCEIESYILTVAGMSSYLWTIILAFYFYNITSSRRSNREAATKLMPIYHLIAWGIPVLVAFPLLCTGKLPFAPFVGGLWCYVTVHGSFQHVEPFSEKHIAVAVSVKLPEFFAFVIIVLLYSATVINIRRQVKSSSDPNESSGFVRVNKILTLIPILFIILRIWSLVQYFYTISIAKRHPNGCVPHRLKTGYLTLGILQVKSNSTYMGEEIYYVYT